MDEILIALNNISCDISNKTNEDNVEIILKKFLLKLNKNEKLEEKSYISQPNGRQKFPDFILKIENKIYNLECKSSKTAYKPLWNCSFPKLDNTIYIFTHRKFDDTIIFLGNELMTKKLQNILERYKERTKDLENEFNYELTMLNKNENPYNIQVYARNMFIQKSNLVKHEIKNLIKKIKFY